MSDFDDLDRHSKKIEPRKCTELNFDPSTASRAGAPILLDTNTVISALQKKLPQPIRELTALAPNVASSVVIGEMTQGLYLLDPADPRTPQNRGAIARAIEEMSKIDRIVPTDEDWRLANAVLATLGRVNNFDKVKRREMLSDSLIYVGVRRTGVALVTGDIADFDYLQQALPGGQIVFFEAVPPANKS